MCVRKVPALRVPHRQAPAVEAITDPAHPAEADRQAEATHLRETPRRVQAAARVLAAATAAEAVVAQVPAAVAAAPAVATAVLAAVVVRAAAAEEDNFRSTTID